MRPQIAHLRQSSRPTPFCTFVAYFLLFRYAAALGDDTPAKRTEFVRFVPLQAAAFVDISRAPELDQALTRCGLSKFLTAFLPRTEYPKDNAILRSTFATALEIKDAKIVSDIMRSEIGILVASPDSISKAMYFVRLPGKDSLDQWFEPSKRRETELANGAKLIRTDSGLMLGLRDDIIAVAVKSTDGRLFREVLRLMSGRSSTSFESDEGFRRLDPYLPAKDIATLYLTPARMGKSDSIVGALGVQRLMAGAYHNEGRIELAVRANLSRPNPSAPLGEVTLDRMMSLPATTLFSAATRWPVGMAGEQQGIDFATLVFKWVRPVYERFKSIQMEAGATPRPGSSPVILALDEDISQSGGMPQFAILIQTSNAREKCSELAAAIQNALPEINAADGNSGGGGPQQLMYSDQAVWHLPLCEGNESKPERLECMLKLDPAWTSSGDWLVFSLTRRYLERIIGAEKGAPRLSGLPDLRFLRERRAPQTGMLIAQPALANKLLDRWIAEGSEPSDSFSVLAWEIATDLSPPRRGDRLGIGVRAEQRPGSVIVARVEADTPSAKKLQTDDRIVGVNGFLLDFTSPNADLRERWDKLAPKETMTLRVERGETAFEVALEKPDVDAPTGSDAIPGTALSHLRHLLALAKSTSFITVSLPATDEKHLSLFITLRPAPPGSGTSASQSVPRP